MWWLIITISAAIASTIVIVYVCIAVILRRLNDVLAIMH